jgi:hypothetical protein
MKLVTKIPWNSFASLSVNPDSEPFLSSAILHTSTNWSCDHEPHVSRAATSAQAVR